MSGREPGRILEGKFVKGEERDEGDKETRSRRETRNGGRDTEREYPGGKGPSREGRLVGQTGSELRQGRGRLGAGQRPDPPPEAGRCWRPPRGGPPHRARPLCRASRTSHCPVPLGRHHPWKLRCWRRGSHPWTRFLSSQAFTWGAGAADASSWEFVAAPGATPSLVFKCASKTPCAQNFSPSFIHYDKFELSTYCVPGPFSEQDTQKPCPVALLVPPLPPVLPTPFSLVLTALFDPQVHQLFLLHCKLSQM